MKSEGRDGQRLSQVVGTSPSGAQNTLGEGKQKPPCGRLGEEGRDKQKQPKGGPRRSKRHQGERRGCNKRKRGRTGRERKGGLESGSPRERTGGADKESANRPRDGPPCEALSASLPGPPGLPGKPMRSLTLTAGGRGGCGRSSRGGAQRGMQLRTPLGSMPCRGSPVFSLLPPASLPLMAP